VFDEELDNILDEVREAMDGFPEAAVDKELARFREAADDARAVFLEREMRPFLSMKSDAVG
jgi:hypothetical protein